MRLKEIGLIGIFLTGLFSCQTQNKISRTVLDEDWNLIWEDDFSEDGRPNPEKWRFAGRGTPAWQCYCTDDPSTAYVKNGKLYLKGKVSEDSRDTAIYQTGCIETKTKFSFKYGKLEAKIKVPMVQGTWPALWLMPEKSIFGTWPKSGEIDIMEYLDTDSIFYQTMHSGYIEIDGEKDNPPYVNKQPFNPKEFNIFSVEWFPDRIDFFLNGERTHTYPKLINGPSNQWPFDESFYIIMDLAMGGCDWFAAPKDNSLLPATMEIDWIKVYQKNSQDR